jgi:hypothetical protein
MIKYEGYTLNIGKKYRFARQNGSLRGEMQAMAEYNLSSSLSGYAVTIKNLFTAEKDDKRSGFKTILL